MKKDKAWLKGKVYSDLPHVDVILIAEDGATKYIETAIPMEEVFELIDQLDEPEITLDKAFEKVAETHSLTKEQIARHLEKLETCGGKVIYGEPEMSMTLINAQQPLDKIEEYMVKPIIPQFVADWIERQRKYEPEPVITAMNRLRTHGTRELMVWFEYNPDLYARAWLDGYEVEKELLWEIPIPDLKTSDGHIQYLTYDPKAKTYFAARKNERLKQTFNTKDFVSVPEQYKRYAELCGFNKIEEVTE